MTASVPSTQPHHAQPTLLGEDTEVKVYAVARSGFVFYTDVG